MSQPQRRTAVWVRPASTTPSREGREPAPGILKDVVVTIPGLPAPLSLREAVEKHGLPSFPDLTADAELRELLLAAAEIEHGLMAQYLYAASACTDSAFAQLVREIAVEEMGHLLTVQNLLLAAGGTPYLGRYERSPNEFDPFPFSLEPFTFEVIAKYAACEMPDRNDIDPEELETLPAMLEDAAASAGAVEVHRIGLLYMKIYWLLRETDAPLPDPAEEPWEGYPVELLAGIFPGRHLTTFPVAETLSAQGKKEDWQSNTPSVIIRTVSGRREALGAVAQISAQGEGFAGEADAHFDRFVTLYREAKAAGPVARPFATSPWYVGSGSAPGKPEAEITSALAIDFSKLGDRLYELLLIAITLALHPKNEFDEQKRRLFARFSIALMRDAIKPYARALPRLNIGDAAASPQLSLCMTLPDLPDDPAGLRARLNQRYAEALALAKTLEALPGIHTALRAATNVVRVFLETSRGNLNIP